MAAVGNETEAAFEITELEVNGKEKTVLVVDMKHFNYRSFIEKADEISQVEFVDSTWYYNNMVPLRTYGKDRSNLLFTPNENVVLNIIKQPVEGGDEPLNWIANENGDPLVAGKRHFEVEPGDLKDKNTYRGFYGLINAISQKNHNDRCQAENFTCENVVLTVTFMVSLCPGELWAR